MSRVDVRAQILQQAGAIFAAEGYRGTTIRKICSRAGVNVAAVNYYFGDKEGLYVEAVKHARELIEQRWPLPTLSADLPAADRLRVFVQTLLRRLLSPQTSEWQTRLLLREIVEPTRAGEELVREGVQPFFCALVETLRPLAPAGVSEPQLQQIGFSVMGQCIFYRAHQRAVRLIVSPDDYVDQFSVDALADHISEFSLAALRALNPIDQRTELEPPKAGEAQSLEKKNTRQPGTALGQG